MARRRKMDPERKAFISSLLEHYQPKDTEKGRDGMCRFLCPVSAYHPEPF